jgi:hypothetical protein
MATGEAGMITIRITEGDYVKVANVFSDGRMGNGGHLISIKVANILLVFDADDWEKMLLTSTGAEGFYTHNGELIARPRGR